jgi:hypothetical protein
MKIGKGREEKRKEKKRRGETVSSATDPLPFTNRITLLH